MIASDDCGIKKRLLELERDWHKTSRGWERSIFQSPLDAGFEYPLDIALIGGQIPDVATVITSEIDAIVLEVDYGESGNELPISFKSAMKHLGLSIPIIGIGTVLSLKKLQDLGLIDYQAWEISLIKTLLAVYPANKKEAAVIDIAQAEAG